MITNPFDSCFYNEHELKDVGFKSLGSNIKISKNCTIIGVENIEIGNNVRIDDYCSLIASSGYVRLGSFIHIASYCLLAAGDGIEMDDFSGLSQGCRIHSRTDDYSGQYLTNPTVPEKYKKITGGTVTLARHVIVGSGSVILPKVKIGEGTSIGALSLVTKSLEPLGIFFGCPVKKIKNRSKRILELEEEFKASDLWIGDQ